MDERAILHASIGLGPDLSPMQGRSVRAPQPRSAPAVDKSSIQPSRTVTETARRARMEQAESASQSSVGTADYRWATLTQGAQIGGHSFPAGTRIAVAPGQTQTSGGGKAHTTSVVTKVWAKFGQTFDASSWVQGWLVASAFSYTGQKATWSNATGFGEPTSMQGRRRGYRPPVPVPTAVESPLEHAATLERAQGYRPPLPVPTAVEDAADSRSSPTPARGVGELEVVEQVKKEASGVLPFFFGVAVGAGIAATVTYFWLENESRTVYLDGRASRYGRRPHVR